MNIGKKISVLKDSIGFKNYQEFGKAVGLNGEWLLELSKKEVIQTVDITRLIKISEYFNVSIDWLLKDENDIDLSVKQDLQDNDIGVMLDYLQTKINESENKFYGYDMSIESKKLASDSIDVIKKLIKQNI